MAGTARQKAAERLLADLIFRVSPRMDARAVARQMTDRYGSIAPALEANAVDMEREGLSRNAAQLIAALPQLARYIETESAMTSGGQLSTRADCGRYFAARCVGLRHERLFLACLGPDGAVRDVGAVTDGTLDETPFYMRMILERALLCEARYLVLCHNHPSGAAYASISDVKATRQLIGACGELGLVLLDHLIIADGMVVSMRDDNIGEAAFEQQAPGDLLLRNW